MSQLYSLSSQEFTVTVALTNDGALKRKAPTTSIPVWPDRTFCYPIAYYIHHLIDAGCTTAPSGGTIKTYCGYLSQLIRLCDKKFFRDFLNINDEEFSNAVYALYDSKIIASELSSPRPRNATTARAIVVQWLNFLEFYSHLRCQPNFLGVDGVIRAKKTRINTGHGKRGKRYETTWSHPSLPDRDPYNFQSPIAVSHLKLLKRAVSQAGGTPFTVRRRLVMLEIFSVTGFRRIEASLLRVKDVQEAVDNLDHAIRVRSRGHKPNVPASVGEASHLLKPFSIKFRIRKQPNNKEDRLRTTPVSAVTLQFFKEYLQARAIELKRRGIQDDADAPFFINLSTGNAYVPNYFTQEFHLLAKIAGLQDVPCSPHRVRARFIVNALVQLAKAAIEAAGGDAKGFLLDFEDLIGKLMEITGHLSPESVKVYIQLARSEIFGLDSRNGRQEMERQLAAIDNANEMYRAQCASGVDVATAGRELARAIEAARAVTLSTTAMTQ